MIAETRKAVVAELRCPHCRAGEPSVWDSVLFHYAHPDGDKLKMCDEPWRERCRRCSADLEHYDVRFCRLHVPEAT